MRYSWLLFLLGCYQPQPREGDLWEKYARGPVPKGNLRIRVNYFEFTATSTRAADLAWGYRGENIAVSGGDLYASNGFTIFGGKHNFVAAFGSESVRISGRREREEFILVADGREGLLRVARITPVPVLEAIPIFGGVALIQTVRHRVAGSGMFVRATSQADGMIETELIPYFSYQEAGRWGTMRISELRSVVRVRPGEPIVMMAHRERARSFGASFFSVRDGNETRKIIIVLRIER